MQVFGGSQECVKGKTAFLSLPLVPFSFQRVTPKKLGGNLDLSDIEGSSYTAAFAHCKTCRRCVMEDAHEYGSPAVQCGWLEF